MISYEPLWNTLKRKGISQLSLIHICATLFDTVTLQLYTWFPHLALTTALDVYKRQTS